MGGFKGAGLGPGGMGEIKANAKENVGAERDLSNEVADGMFDQQQAANRNQGTEIMSNSLRGGNNVGNFGPIGGIASILEMLAPLFKGPEAGGDAFQERMRNQIGARGFEADEPGLQTFTRG
jgi:hypothetical protein